MMTVAEYIGRFHPLLVHLPIGILLFGFALMLYQKVRKVDVTEAISLAWLAGAVAALLSCGAGWLLAPVSYTHLDVYKRQLYKHPKRALVLFYFFCRALRSIFRQPPLNLPR